MSLYVLVLLGGQAIGGPIMGWVVSTFGPHVGMAVSGLVPAVAAVAVGIHLARKHELRVQVHPPGSDARSRHRAGIQRLRISTARANFRSLTDSSRRSGPVRPSLSTLSKVPEIAVAFWITKALTTGMGESTSDYLVLTLGPAIAIGTGALVFAAALVAQFRVSRPRELFHWATVLTTFALGTAAGDLTATTFHLGFLGSGIVFAVVIAAHADRVVEVSAEPDLRVLVRVRDYPAARSVLRRLDGRLTPEGRTGLGHRPGQPGPQRVHPGIRDLLGVSRRIAVRRIGPVASDWPLTPVMREPLDHDRQDRHQHQDDGDEVDVVRDNRDLAEQETGKGHQRGPGDGLTAFQTANRRTAIRDIPTIGGRNVRTMGTNRARTIAAAPYLATNASACRRYLVLKIGRRP